MTPNTILEPTSPAMEAASEDAMLEGGAEVGGEAATLLDDRPGGHLDAMVMPEGKAEPRRDGAKELMQGSWSDIDWAVLGWIGGIHIAALAAPFCFTWSGLLIAAVLAWVTGGLGVCLGYHRLLTHGSFGTYRPVRWLFAFLGGISGEGSSLIWVANHRKHHVFSDQEGDPHSPRDGGFWAHVLWLFPKHPQAEVDAHIKRWAPDLQKDARVVATRVAAIRVAATRVAATRVAGRAEVAPKGAALPREQSSQVAPLQSERPKRRRHPRLC